MNGANRPAIDPNHPRRALPRFIDEISCAAKIRRHIGLCDKLRPQIGCIGGRLSNLVDVEHQILVVAHPRDRKNP